MTGEAERAIQIQSPTLNAANAASEPSQSQSFCSIGVATVIPERKCTVTIVQRTCLQLQAKTTRGGYMAADNCQIKPGDTEAVMGPGPVGQFAIALCIRRSPTPAVWAGSGNAAGIRETGSWRPERVW